LCGRWIAGITLNVPEEEAMTPEPALADPLAMAHALAARAFLAGAACTQARVGVLLDTAGASAGWWRPTC